MIEFDLFRLNCFLNDTQANDFKRIVISLVSEYIFDNKNQELSKSFFIKMYLKLFIFNI